MGYRRIPPTQSESLPLHKRQKLVHADNKEQNHDPLTATILQEKQSQGSGSAESASNWFDSVNKNVETGERNSPQTSGMLVRSVSSPMLTRADEPPFYLSTLQSRFPE